MSRGDALRAAAVTALSIDLALASRLRIAARVSDELDVALRAALAGMPGRQTR